MKPSLPRRRPRAFTLTEILIALAMVTLLLAGISRIFALTSTTISSGQALSKAMRSHKAIQTQLSNDFLGVGDIGRPDYDSGMLPLINTADSDYASPFLSISNMRIAAYKNKADEASDTIQPVVETSMNGAKFIARSRAIRGMDLNKDGDEADAGELVPLYAYGERNFRVDTLSFFSKGRFRSQTGLDTYSDDVSSNEAWIWYGHLRVFNSVAASLNVAAGYGSPGDLLISGTDPNNNHRYADEFRLGRMAMLMIEPTDIRGLNYDASDANSYARNGVLANGDYSKPIPFVRRNWWRADGNTAGTMLPIGMSGDVYKFSPSGTFSSAQNINRRLTTNDILEGQTGAATTITSAAMGRTDVAGAGIKQMRQRASYFKDYASTSTTPTMTNRLNWRNDTGITSTDRYYMNPFPAKPFDSRGMSRRQQLLAESASQFIVEYAGDFVGQNADGSLMTGAYADGTPRATTPDGVLDFIVINPGPTQVRQTRWYGMPRDVDGNGSIAGWGNVAGMLNSPDVVPLGDFADTRADVTNVPTIPLSTSAIPLPVYPFERKFPPITRSATADYLNVTAIPDEPTPPFPTQFGPDLTRYTCVWGPSDFENTREVTIGTKKVITRPVPQLIRVLVDIRDPNGRLKEPVTQEFIYPVRVTAAIEQPK